MKAKLLKKLRKRFRWYREIKHNCWTLYDKKTKKESYCYVIGLHYINDMAIYTMLEKMDKLKLFKLLRDRIDERHEARRLRDRIRNDKIYR